MVNKKVSFLFCIFLSCGASWALGARLNRFRRMRALFSSSLAHALEMRVQALGVLHGIDLYAPKTPAQCDQALELYERYGDLCFRYLCGRSRLKRLIQSWPLPDSREHRLIQEAMSREDECAVSLLETQLIIRNLLFVTGADQ